MIVGTVILYISFFLLFLKVLQILCLILTC